MHPLSETGHIVVSCCSLVAACLGLFSVILRVRLQSFVLVYWPYFSLGLAFLGIALYIVNWKRVTVVEKTVAIAFFCQLYRHYEMHGEDWKLRDDQFRTDFCKSLFGHKDRWFCIYDEPLIFSIHFLSDLAVGVGAIYYCHTKPTLNLISHGYSLALSFCIFVMAISEAKYIAGSLASIICFFFNFYCTGCVKRMWKLRSLRVMKYVGFGFMMRFLTFFAIILHPGKPRLNVRQKLVYVDGIYHKLFIVLQVLLSCMPFMYTFLSQNPKTVKRVI